MDPPAATEVVSVSRGLRDTEPGSPAASTSADAATGAFAQRFEVRDRLGRGAFGVVDRAWDRELRREVAIKRLRLEHASTTARERFRREAAVARDVHHPAVARIFEIGSERDEMWLVLELLPGGSLRDRITRGPLEVEEVLSLCAALLEGLVALHAANLVHRDIKPENLLFDEAGQLKIADFGIARRLDGAATQLTATDGLIGTITYMSPEQALGEPVDGRSDLYSVGVVVYEMLTGSTPFRGRSEVGALVDRLDRRSHHPRLRDPHIPRWLARFVSRLLERSPTDRPASAAAALAELRSRCPARSRRTQRHRITALAVVVLVSAGLWGAVTARRGSDPELGIEPTEEGWLVRAADGTKAFTLPKGGAVVARPKPGEPRLVYFVADPAGLSPPKRMVTYDHRGSAASGEIELPDFSQLYPELPPSFRAEVFAFDIDGDGGDEVFVTMIHHPYWPSYTLLWEPRLERIRLAFVGSGHHRPLAAVDLDADGNPEVLFAGGNNRVGNNFGLAATYLEPPVGRSSPRGSRRTGATPDSDRVPGPGGLMWYGLGPPGYPILHHPPEISSEQRTITVELTDQSRLTYNYEGFLVSDLPPLGLDPASRQLARNRAWEALREARRFESTGDSSRVVAALARARSEAQRARDTPLTAWASRQWVLGLLSAGQQDAALAAWEEIWSGSAEIALEAGTALHRAGALEEAATWLERAAAQGAPVNASPLVRPLLEALLLLDLERGILAETAPRHLARFRAFYSDSPERDTAQAYEIAVATWLGRPTDLTVLEAAIRPLATQPRMVWFAEAFRLAGAPERAAELVAREQSRGWAEEPELLFLQAELMADAGQKIEGLALGRRAWELMTAAPTTCAQRAQLPRYAARLELLEARLDPEDEVPTT